MLDKDKQIADLQAKVKELTKLVEKGNELDKEYNDDLEIRLNENENLKQKLIELPKKIMDEIVEYCEKYYSHNEFFDSIIWQENCPIKTVYTLKEFLNNLLKKYEDKN